ncbi:MAG: CopG family transcriptional regulator [Chloroflexi bacterium]|nr:CopG family transcriptional regulator [Chloroflexota bacterium]
MTQAEKVTISLPKEMVLFADRLAKEKKISRSKAIASLLEEAARRRFEAEMVEGYQVMAEENRKFAAMVFEAQREILPEWEPGEDA